MNSGIGVVAAFNPMGEIKPVYVQLMDENSSLQTYKIEVNSSRPEKYSGINTILYFCTFYKNDLKQELKIKFYFDSHKWVEIQ